ncbi:hypothetical protein BJX76DRAFT_356477 [Aspergillus varians]
MSRKGQGPTYEMTPAPGFLHFLLSLFLKDWTERWPGVKWIWPRAWDEARAAKHETTDASSGAGGDPMIDLTPIETEMKDVLTRLEDLQSNLQKVNDELRIREETCDAREDKLSQIEVGWERGKELLTKLEGVADSLKAREEALSACCERHILRERATRRFVSNAHRILDRKDQ